MTYLNKRGQTEALVILLAVPIIILSLVITYNYMKEVSITRTEQRIGSTIASVDLDYWFANMIERDMGNDESYFLNIYDPEYRESNQFYEIVRAKLVHFASGGPNGDDRLRQGIYRRIASGAPCEPQLYYKHDNNYIFTCDSNMLMRTDIPYEPGMLETQEARTTGAFQREAVIAASDNRDVRVRSTIKVIR